MWETGVISIRTNLGRIREEEVPTGILYNYKIFPASKYKSLLPQKMWVVAEMMMTYGVQTYSYSTIV